MAEADADGCQINQPMKMKPKPKSNAIWARTERNEKDIME